MRVRAAALGFALGASGCAGAGGRPSTTLYFLGTDRSAPVAVTRPGALTAREALDELFDGPTPEEARRGISTAIPSEARVRELRIRDGDARIHFAGLPNPPGAAERFRIITQLTKSLTGRSGVRRLWLRNDGQPWGFWRRRGGIREGPYHEGACVTVGDGAPGAETVIADAFSSC